MHLFRIHIRPYGGSGDMTASFNYCLQNQLLGVGWRTANNTNTKDWSEYYEQACLVHQSVDVCQYIQQRIANDDLVWTRSPQPCKYYLARVISGWEYWVSNEGRLADIDIANVFRCEIREVEIDDVPGKVISSFRGRRTIQEIPDIAAREYSKSLWNRLLGTDLYEVNASEFEDIFMMLSADETEDLVFLYLQSRGWFVIPHSRKADTMSFEYLVVDPKTGERALTQVKTGNEVLSVESYRSVRQRVFLFQSNGLYQGESENVTRITRSELLSFMNSSKGWLPGVFEKKQKIIAAAKETPGQGQLTRNEVWRP